jgi:predicted NAD/FAD-binding protein
VGVVSLQHQDHRVVLADTVRREHSRDQKALINSRLQLHDDSHVAPRRVLATHTWRYAPRRKHECVSIGHVVGGRHRTSDIAVADHKYVAAQTVRPTLHCHPRQTQGRVDGLRDGPVLQTETVVRLVQLHLE